MTSSSEGVAGRLGATTPAATTRGRERSAGAQPGDRRRQVVVTVSEIACLLGTLVGVGVLGGPPVAQASGGALAADATLIAPAGPAFGIWTPIYLGLAAYTVWQWLPGQTTSARHRSVGYLAALSMLLNAGWLLVVRAGWLWVSVVVILALAVTLGLLVARLTATPSSSRVEKVVVDGTFGAYLGWVAVATCANVTATLVDAGVRPSRPVSETAAVVVLVVAAGLGLLFAERLGGRWAVGLAMAWGLGWIAYARWATEPASTVVSIAAALAAVAVLVAAARFHRSVDRTDPATA